jgi:hypothetical protein
VGMVDIIAVLDEAPTSKLKELHSLNPLLLQVEHGVAIIHLISIINMVMVEEIMEKHGVGSDPTYYGNYGTQSAESSGYSYSSSSYYQSGSLFIDEGNSQTIINGFSGGCSGIALSSGGGGSGFVYITSHSNLNLSSNHYIINASKEISTYNGDSEHKLYQYNHLKLLLPLQYHVQRDDIHYQKKLKKFLIINSTIVQN